VGSPSSFRLPADVVAGWKEALSKERAVKGVEAILKEVLDVLLKEDTEGHVPVTRHQLFSWVQALQGLALKVPAFAGVADEMRAYMGQGPGAAGQGARDGPAPGAPATAASTTAPAPGAPRVATAAPPPVVYTGAAAKTGAPASTAATRIVTERELLDAVARLVREARSELVLVAPWSSGLDTLAKDLLAVTPGVMLRILTRRPPTDEVEYQRVMQELRRRDADVVLSNALHTRAIVVDGSRMLLGAAGLLPGTREMALLTTDVSLVAPAREAILKLMMDARK
jgi:hypothetical protein